MANGYAASPVSIHGFVVHTLLVEKSVMNNFHPIMFQVFYLCIVFTKYEEQLERYKKRVYTKKICLENCKRKTAAETLIKMSGIALTCFQILNMFF